VSFNGHDAHGRWKTGNRQGGRYPKALERDYLRAAKKAVSNRQWLELCKRAYGVAMSDTAHPIAVAKARDFLLKALMVDTRPEPEDEETVRLSALPPEILLAQCVKSLMSLGVKEPIDAVARIVDTKPPEAAPPS
jgi:hypothetical protein